MVSRKPPQNVSVDVKPVRSVEMGVASRTIIRRPLEPARGPVSFRPMLGLFAFARQMLKTRKNWTQHFPKGLFRDSAWDMMLELFVALEKGEPLCVKQLTLAVDESPAGASRRIDRLEEAQLVKRRLDSSDHRRVLVELTDKGREAMAAMLKHLFAVGQQVPTESVAQPRPFAPE